MRWALVLVLIVAGAASAAELRSIEVEHHKGEYSLVSEAWFDAGLDETFEIFRHWDYSTKFSSAIVEAKDLEPDETGRPGFYIQNRGCILFICFKLVRQGYVELQHNKVLRAFADPELSDFEFSNETWTFAEVDGGTSVLYELHMDPKVWVPPAIGPYMIKRKLRSDGSSALDIIEALAKELAAGNEIVVE